MAIQALMKIPLKRDSFGRSSLGHPVEFRSPALAPTGTFASADISLRQALGPVSRDERFFQPLEKNFTEVGTSFEFHRKIIAAVNRAAAGINARKLVAGGALAAGLGACAFAYVVLGSSNDNTVLKTTEVSLAILSSPANSVELASNTSEPSPVVTYAAAAQPKSGSSVMQASSEGTVKVSESVGSATFPTITEPRQSVPARNRDVLFLQRAGVKIRSAPSTSGTVLGTAPKGTRFEVMTSERDWVQVEKGRLKGWISAQFLAATAPAITRRGIFSNDSRRDFPFVFRQSVRSLFQL